MSLNNILLATEIDLYINTMKCYDITDIGKPAWMEWHARVSKLNQQALEEASEMREEVVKEMLAVSGKIPVLVHEAICISVWKNNVLPLILSYESDPKNTFFIYSVLYHETTCVTLLEIVLFHVDSCETLNDSSLDLFEYCYEAITKLFNYKFIESPSFETLLAETPHDELKRQQGDLYFDIGIRAISIMRYLAEYLERLPLSIAKRMYSHQDVPLLLAQLIELTPWVRKDKKGNTLKYIGSKWHVIAGKELSMVTQTEAQVWLGLRQLLLNPELLACYELTSYRKDQLNKLQKYLHTSVLDQLSPLIDLKQWLSHLLVSEQGPCATHKLILEVIPEIKERILSKHQDNWSEIARAQVKLFFKQDQKSLIEVAQRMHEMYSSDLVEKMDKPRKSQCGGCDKMAAKACSRCKSVWYCSRNCQVKHWPQHKESCDMHVGAN